MFKRGPKQNSQDSNSKETVKAKDTSFVRRKKVKRQASDELEQMATFDPFANDHNPFAGSSHSKKGKPVEVGEKMLDADSSESDNASGSFAEEDNSSDESSVDVSDAEDNSSTESSIEDLHDSGVASASISNSASSSRSGSNNSGSESGDGSSRSGSRSGSDDSGSESGGSSSRSGSASNESGSAGSESESNESSQSGDNESTASGEDDSSSRSGDDESSASSVSGSSSDGSGSSGSSEEDDSDGSSNHDDDENSSENESSAGRSRRGDDVATADGTEAWNTGDNATTATGAADPQSSQSQEDSTPSKKGRLFGFLGRKQQPQGEEQIASDPSGEAKSGEAKKEGTRRSFFGKKETIKEEAEDDRDNGEEAKAKSETVDIDGPTDDKPDDLSKKQKRGGFRGFFGKRQTPKDEEDTEVDAAPAGTTAESMGIDTAVNYSLRDKLYSKKKNDEVGETDQAGNLGEGGAGKEDEFGGPDQSTKVGEEAGDTVDQEENQSSSPPASVVSTSDSEDDDEHDSNKSSSSDSSSGDGESESGSSSSSADESSSASGSDDSSNSDASSSSDDDESDSATSDADNKENSSLSNDNKGSDFDKNDDTGQGEPPPEEKAKKGGLRGLFGRKHKPDGEGEGNLKNDEEEVVAGVDEDGGANQRKNSGFGFFGRKQSFDGEKDLDGNAQTRNDSSLPPEPADESTQAPRPQMTKKESHRAFNLSRVAFSGGGTKSKLNDVPENTSKDGVDEGEPRKSSLFGLFGKKEEPHDDRKEPEDDEGEPGTDNVEDSARDNTQVEAESKDDKPRRKMFGIFGKKTPAHETNDISDKGDKENIEEDEKAPVSNDEGSQDSSSDSSDDASSGDDASQDSSSSSSSASDDGDSRASSNKEGDKDEESSEVGQQENELKDDKPSRKFFVFFGRKSTTERHDTNAHDNQAEDTNQTGDGGLEEEEKDTGAGGVSHGADGDGVGDIEMGGSPSEEPDANQEKKSQQSKSFFGWFGRKESPSSESGSMKDEEGKNEVGRDLSESQEKSYPDKEEVDSSQSKNKNGGGWLMGLFSSKKPAVEESAEPIDDAYEPPVTAAPVGSTYADAEMGLGSIEKKGDGDDDQEGESNEQLEEKKKRGWFGFGWKSRSQNDEQEAEEESESEDEDDPDDDSEDDDSDEDEESDENEESEESEESGMFEYESPSDEETGEGSSSEGSGSEGSYDDEGSYDEEGSYGDEEGFYDENDDEYYDENDDEESYYGMDILSIIEEGTNESATETDQFEDEHDIDKQILSGDGALAASGRNKSLRQEQYRSKERRQKQQSKKKRNKKREQERLKALQKKKREEEKRRKAKKKRRRRKRKMQGKQPIVRSTQVIITTTAIIVAVVLLLSIAIGIAAAWFVRNQGGIG